MSSSTSSAPRAARARPNPNPNPNTSGSMSARPSSRATKRPLRSCACKGCSSS